MIDGQLRWESLAWNRGEHGPGELSCVMGLDWSPLLALPAPLATGQPVELYDADHLLWNGTLRAIERETDNPWTVHW